MTARQRFETHDIFNQSPPYEDVDLFATDRSLRDAVAANGAAEDADALSRRTDPDAVLDALKDTQEPVP